MLGAMKRATLSAKRDGDIYRSAKRAMRMCERSEQIFLLGDQWNSTDSILESTLLIKIYSAKLFTYIIF